MPKAVPTGQEGKRLKARINVWNDGGRFRAEFHCWLRFCISKVDREGDRETTANLPAPVRGCRCGCMRPVGTLLGRTSSREIPHMSSLYLGTLVRECWFLGLDFHSKPRYRWARGYTGQEPRGPKEEMATGKQSIPWISTQNNWGETPPQNWASSSILPNFCFAFCFTSFWSSSSL